MAGIMFKGTNAKVSTDIKEYFTKKFAPLQKFLREENKVHVELEEDSKFKGPRFRAEITILPRTAKYYADARGSDFNEAIDLVIPKIKAQLLKKKDRVVTRRKTGK